MKAMKGKRKQKVVKIAIQVNVIVVVSKFELIPLIHVCTAVCGTRIK